MPTIPVVNRYNNVQTYNNSTFIQNSPPNYIPGFVMGSTKSIPPLSSMGICRPYFTTIPDGKPKVLLGGYHQDNYIEGIALYADERITNPGYHDTLYLIPSNVVLVPANGNYILATNNGGIEPGYLMSNFGKKYVTLYNEGAPYNIANEAFSVVNEIDLYTNNGAIIGQTYPVTTQYNVSAYSRIYDSNKITINTGKGNKLYVVHLTLLGWAVAYD